MIESNVSSVESEATPEFLTREAERNWRFIRAVEQKNPWVEAEIGEKPKGPLAKLSAKLGRREDPNKRKGRAIQAIKKEFEMIPSDPDAEHYVYRPRFVNRRGETVYVVKALLEADMIPPQAQEAAREYSEDVSHPLSWGRCIYHAGKYAFSVSGRESPRENTLGENAKEPDFWFTETRRLYKNPLERTAIMVGEEFFLLLAQMWYEEKCKTGKDALFLASEKGTMFPDEWHEKEKQYPCINFDPKSKTHKITTTRVINPNNGVRFIRLSRPTGEWMTPRYSA